ncbi:MAG: helix-turn-helix transcriptional regulator [Rhodospirillaceae bacterium]|nr:helix-turn-helix transcriptional regulator [Rhodospirillaceae bacterium]MBT3787126.1 helix-turn-helix transcriptional regulator [Alphaproteobacteria bacterium]MBT4892490.1 helix-turn-helix transcriptional regulator [Gammaproteobacteria bacterium]
MSMNLGEKIKALRTAKKLTLEQLAKKCESSKGYIWEIENRGTRKPSGEKLTLIAQALSVTTDYLLDESASPDEKVLQEAFFRKFSKLEDEDKKKIEQMVDMWGGEE